MSGRIPLRVKPMLATLVAKAFQKDGWVYEEKYDGDRILAYKEGSRVTLLSRNAKDRSEIFSGIAAAVGRLPDATLLLDGEVVAFDAHGVSRFQLLQNLKVEPSYAAFDCLYKEGCNLRAKPLVERRAALEEAVGKSTLKRQGIFPSARLSINGLEAFQIARKKGYEGVVAKNASGPYIEGRSREWLKVKAHHEDDFLIVGYTAPSGAREYFGALLLAAYDGGQLRYVGKVGTGFDRKTLAGLYRAFQPLLRTSPPVTNRPAEKGAAYLSPRLVAQIAYEELTDDRKLRQPVFLGLRDDKRPRDVTLPEAE
jgi:bifunctional non-homologous end joining protein LigD